MQKSQRQVCQIDDRLSSVEETVRIHKNHVSQEAQDPLAAQGIGMCHTEPRKRGLMYHKSVEKP